MKTFYKYFFKSLLVLAILAIDWLVLLPLIGGEDFEIVISIVGLIISVVVLTPLIHSFFKEKK